MNIKKQIFKMAQNDVRTIVFPEAIDNPKIIEAIRFVVRKRIARAIILGDEDELFMKYSTFGVNGVQIINPAKSGLTKTFAKQIYELCKGKGIMEKEAEEKAFDRIYFATMLVKNGYADGMISGSETNSATTFRPALELIKTAEKGDLVTTSMLYFGYNFVFNNHPIIVSDCALVREPNAIQIVKIASNAVDLWRMLFINEPRVAFLSYSTKGSATGESVKKMQKATELFKKKFPDVIADGELQLECAILKGNQPKNSDKSEIQGSANILIAPNLDSANMLGKAVHYVGNMLGVGPISTGFVRPVNYLPYESTIEEIILLIAITVIQSQL